MRFAFTNGDHGEAIVSCDNRRSLFVHCIDSKSSRISEIEIPIMRRFRETTILIR